MSADQLRRAADLIDEFAAGTTPGPWNGHRSDDGPGYGEIAGGPFEHGYRLGTVTRWEGGDGWEPSVEDLRWMCLMSPHVAGPIAAWLREEAWRLADHVAAWSGPRQADFEDGQPSRCTPTQVAALTEHHFRLPLAVARAVLDGSPPVDADTTRRERAERSR